MHAEMHAIYNVTGLTPSFKTQVQALERPSAREKPAKPRQPPKWPIRAIRIKDAAIQSLVLRGWTREACIQKQEQAEATFGPLSLS